MIFINLIWGSLLRLTSSWLLCASSLGRERRRKSHFRVLNRAKRAKRANRANREFCHFRCKNRYLRSRVIKKVKTHWRFLSFFVSIDDNRCAVVQNRWTSMNITDSHTEANELLKAISKEIQTLHMETKHWPNNCEVIVSRLWVGCRIELGLWIGS